MTTLTITPNWKNKTAKFKGTIAAGEHVAVSVANDDGSGSAYISSTTNLRLRVVDERGRTLAQFPMPESNDAWSGTTTLSCELNLNTVQMLMAVPPHATRQLLFVLDAYSEDTPEFTLFFKDCHEVTHWPRRRGEEEPVNLDDYADLIQDFRERIDAAEEFIADKVDEANGIVAYVTAARNDAQSAASTAGIARNEAVAAKGAAEDAATAASASSSEAQTYKNQAQTAASAAADSATSSAASATTAAESASLATAVSIAKMRERTGSQLWHNVALSQNDSGAWVMDVDQSTASDGGLFDAEVKALGTTEARSLASRFADMVNVRDFGARGDGVTDDTVAIRTAISSANGRVVFFPPGTYICKQLTIDYSDAKHANPHPIRLRGSGIGNTTIKNTAVNDSVFVFSYVKGLEVADMTLDDGQVADPETVLTTNTRGYCLYIPDCRDVTIERVKFINYRSCGLHSYSSGVPGYMCENYLLRDLEFDGSEFFSVLAGLEADDSVGNSGMICASVVNGNAYNCRSRNNYTYGLEWKGARSTTHDSGGAELASMSARDCWFVNCLVENCGRPFHFGGWDKGDESYPINDDYNVYGGGCVNCVVRGVAGSSPYSAGRSKFVRFINCSYDGMEGSSFKAVSLVSISESYGIEFSGNAWNCNIDLVRIVNSILPISDTHKTTQCLPNRDCSIVFDCVELSNLSESGRLYSAVSEEQDGVAKKSVNCSVVVRKSNVDSIYTFASASRLGWLVEDCGVETDIYLSTRKNYKYLPYASQTIVYLGKTNGNNAAFYLDNRGIIPSNPTMRLGSSSATNRFATVWTENGSAEARLAALEAAVLALDPNFVNGRS